VQHTACLVGGGVVDRPQFSGIAVDGDDLSAQPDRALTQAGALGLAEALGEL
jgi:hypothetical protein